jgi:hypothetical protein
MADDDTIVKCAVYREMLKKIKRVLVDMFSANFDDLRSLLENLLLVSALLLSFAFSGMQAINHDDLIAADLRWLLAFQDIPQDPHILMHIPSYNVMERHMNAVKFLLVVLVLGMMMYASLLYSRSAENPSVLSYWTAIFSFGILGGYSIIIIGVGELLAANQAIANMVFPLYSSQFSKNISLIYDPVHQEMIEEGWMLQEVYQEQKLSIIATMKAVAISVAVCHVMICFWTGSCAHSETPESEFDLPEEFSWSQKAKYRSILQREEIEKDQLLELSPEVLKSFGIPYGHALKIAKHTGNVKPKVKSENPA